MAEASEKYVGDVKDAAQQAANAVVPHRLFKEKVFSNPRQLWRPVLAMLLAAPGAGILRAVMLNSVVIPVFVFILGGSAALGMLVWRSIWWLLNQGKLE